MPHRSAARFEQLAHRIDRDLEVGVQQATLRQAEVGKQPIGVEADAARDFGEVGEDWRCG